MNSEMMRVVLWLIMIVMLGVVINELAYLNETSLAIILIIMSIAIGVMAYIQLKQIK